MSAQKSVCESCGDEFTVGRGTKGVYCSRECTWKDSGQSVQQHACYTTTKRGYTKWAGSDTADGGAHVYVHRLLAVAEYGFDAVCDNVVHHINGLPYDNRHSNIAVMTQSDHVTQHNQKLSSLDRIRIAELYRDGEITQGDLGEMFGVDNSTISRVKSSFEREEEREEAVADGGEQADD